MGDKYNITLFTSIENIFTSIENNSTDIGFSAITNTYNRENRLDFTNSYFDSGLQIMIPMKKIIPVFGSNYIQNI